MMSELLGFLGRLPTSGELAAATKLPLDMVRRALQVSRHPPASSVPLRVRGGGPGAPSGQGELGPLGATDTCPHPGVPLQALQRVERSLDDPNQKTPSASGIRSMAYRRAGPRAPSEASTRTTSAGPFYPRLAARWPPLGGGGGV